MKKINVLFIAIITMALMMSCGGTPQPTAQAFGPDWMNEMPPEDAFWGIGIAKLQNDNLAMQTATVRAQRDVAQQISVLVQGMLTDYALESGNVDNPRSIQSIENITRSVVNLDLAGATPNQRTRMSDGTWFVRVSVTKEDARRRVNNILNEEADYAEFRSERAQQMLDFQLQQQSVPTGVSSD